MGDYDPFASSQIRVITGIIGFVILISLMKKWGNVPRGFTDSKARKAY
jgi:hypothetical protein